MSNLSVELGKRIRIARWHKVMKQKDLAKKLGVAPNHISEIEHGKKYPSIELLYEIEKVIGPIWRNLK